MMAEEGGEGVVVEEIFITGELSREGIDALAEVQLGDVLFVELPEV